jgi:hypothetical protein
MSDIPEYFNFEALMYLLQFNNSIKTGYNTIVEKVKKYNGYFYMVDYYRGCRYGYVRLKSTASFLKGCRFKDFKFPINVIGGITFAEDFGENTIIGFNTNDYMLLETLQKHYRTVPAVETLEFMEKECESMIDQIISLEKQYENNAPRLI